MVSGNVKRGAAWLPMIAVALVMVSLVSLVTSPSPAVAKAGGCEGLPLVQIGGAAWTGESCFIAAGDDGSALVTINLTTPGNDAAGMIAARAILQNNTLAYKGLSYSPQVSVWADGNGSVHANLYFSLPGGAISDKNFLWTCAGAGYQISPELVERSE